MMKRKEENLKQHKIIISGGGTGGHIFPAIAIANALKEKLPNVEFLFVGANGRMEMEKVPAAGYKIVGLNISGLQRRLTYKNLFFPFKVIASLWKAKKIINDFKPDAAIGTGGYASGPMLWAASGKNIPSLIQEQNSYPGITNKSLSRKVDKICVAYEGLEKFFPSQKLIITGNPVRKDIVDAHRLKNEAAAYFNLPELNKTVLVIGGSLGAGTINKSVKAALQYLANENHFIIWQTGKSFYPEAKQLESAYPFLRVHDFISRMDLAYATAAIVVSRAGALSVSEICVAGKPCILIPSPNVAEDHQTKNARYLVDKNAALLLKDNEAENKLADVLLLLMKDTAKQKNLSENISGLAKPDASDKIAEEVIKLLNVKK